MAEACHPARLFGSHTLGSSSACARTRKRKARKKPGGGET
jgi:hypothetical protein